MVQFVTTFLDPILSPLLLLPPFWAILLVAFVMSVVITIVYKYTTNQVVMRELKGELKKGREKIKAAKGKPEKQMEIQTKLLKIQNKYMLQSLRPTLFTMLPIILLLGWMQAYYAVESLDVNDTFNATARLIEGASGNITLTVDRDGLTILQPTQAIMNQEMTWAIEANQPGDYILTFDAGTDQAEHPLRVGEGGVTDRGQRHDGVITRTQVNYDKLVVIPVTIFGWQPGWLAAYIIFSLIFSIAFRKLLNVA